MLIHKPDKEWYEVARRFKAELLDHVISPNVAELSVYPAYRGGWKKGYSWSGRFRVVVSPKLYGVAAPRCRKTFYIPESIESARKAWDKIKADVLEIEQACRIVFIYRHSGLIPKHIAKAHGKALQKLGIGTIYDSKEYRAKVTGMMWKYISRYSKCPECGVKGLTGTIAGFECGKCGGYFDDMFSMKWIPPPKG